MPIENFVMELHDQSDSESYFEAFSWEVWQVERYYNKQQEEQVGDVSVLEINSDSESESEEDPTGENDESVSDIWTPDFTNDY